MDNPVANYQWRRNGIPTSSSACAQLVAGGDYELLVDIKGCSASHEFIVTAHLSPAPATVSGTFDLFCNGADPAWLVAETTASPKK